VTLCGAHAVTGASFVLVLEALCDHVYQQPQPTAEPLAREPHFSVLQAAQPDAVDTTVPSLPSALAQESLPSPATAAPVKAPSIPAAAASSGGHGMVVDALASLPSIHARRSVIVDSNGATFSVDDVAARRLRKEQRRKRQQAQEATAGAQCEELEASVADEKPNALPAAAAEPWTDVPAEFCCAVNGSLIKQPVRARCVALRRASFHYIVDVHDCLSQVQSKYGHSFDRSCILKWLQQHANTCPITSQPLTPADLSPDVELEKRIHGWQIQQTLKQQRLFDDLYEF